MVFPLAFILSAAALGLASPLFTRAPQVITKCTVPNTVALTFDDGAYIYEKDIVNLLDQYGARGTFFINGDNYRCIYDQDIAENVKYTYDHGHQIASHTWSHKDLAKLNNDQINDEMFRVEEAVRKITGAQVAFMRPPYGSYNDQVTQVSKQRNQSLTVWDFDSGDSVGASVDKQKASYDDLIKRHPQNILSLEHEVYNTTVKQVLPYIVPKLKNAGYRLVTVAECVGLPAYQFTGAASPHDGSWQC